MGTSKIETYIAMFILDKEISNYLQVYWDTPPKDVVSICLLSMTAHTSLFDLQFVD